MGLAVVRDVREARVPAGPEELAAFETDVLPGFVLARAAAGLSDRAIRKDERGAGDRPRPRRGGGPRSLPPN
jgi:hypothetical protein